MRRPTLTALLTVAALTAAAAFGAAPALASHDETVFFESPHALLAPATQAASLEQLQSLGVHALRVVLYWRDVAPHPDQRRRPAFNQANPAAYDWGAYDPLIAAATARHWKVLLSVSGPVPRWATPHGEDIYSYPDDSDFRQFMQAVGRHYGTRVKLFSIWNEPNEPGFLRPQYVRGKLASAAIYRGLFLAGYRGLEASGKFAGMSVLMGETSPTGVASQGVPAPLAFLRGVLCLNADYKPVGHCSRLPADGYAQHPYSNAKGPFWTPPADDVTIGTIGRLVTALNRAAAAGALRAGLDVYITEFGVQSLPNPYVGVSLAKQAEFQAISERIAWSNPRVASFSQYLLADDHPVNGRTAGFQTGLETYRGTPKPAYDGFRLPLTVTRESSAGVSFWGLVLPAGHSTNVEVQYSPDGGRSWHGLAQARTAADGAWSATGRFVAGRLWRVRWVSSAAGHATFFGAPTRAYGPTGRLYS
jgi:hypothetical protein